MNNAHQAILTLKAPVATKAEDIFYFQKKTSRHFMWIVCKQKIHMKYQNLFSLKKKKNRLCLAL